MFVKVMLFSGVVFGSMWMINSKMTKLVEEKKAR
jgi:hypothetical protein